MQNKDINLSSILFSLQSENKIEFENKQKLAKDDQTFANLIKGETKSKDKSEKKDSEKLVHNEKQARETQKEMEEKLRHTIQRNDLGLSSMFNYLYYLVMKNPDTLSMGEKQMIGVHAEGKEKVGTQKLRQMLAQRGLQLSDLSSKDIEKLAKVHDETQLAFLLESMAREKKGLKTAPMTKAEEKLEKQQDASGSEKVKAASDLKREEVIKQIIDHILIRSAGMKDKEIVIKMNPEYMGQLKVTLEIKDDKVSARFETTSRAVKEIIQESRKELEEALKGQKLSLGRLSAEVVEDIT